MRNKVLLSAPYMLMEREKFVGFFKDNNIDVNYADGYQPFEPRGDVMEHLSEQELLDVIADYDGSICGDDPYTRTIFEKAKKLKVISKWGTGINTIDSAAAADFGVKICNTPNAFSHPVSDTALSYMLAFARNVVQNTADVKNGIWRKTQCFTLGEKTLGIIGIGNIGTQVARRASAFGMNILGNDIRPIAPIILEQYGIEMVSREEMYARADIITIHCDLNESSYHLLNDIAFTQMKNKPYIINTARGEHIDHNALVRALESGLISGAGLDVFEVEPIDPIDKLLTFDNVFLAPHNSNSSPKYWDLVHKNTLKNLVENL
jgi:phosphoglycerate dehydrogenase-like enzyme